MNLLRLFTNENRWLKNGMAKYKDGSSVPFTYLYNSNIKEPWSFSLQGAVSFYTEPESDSRNKIMAKLSKAIASYTGKQRFVAEFNNDPDTSFQDLISVLKIYNKLQ